MKKENIEYPISNIECRSIKKKLRYWILDIGYWTFVVRTCLIAIIVMLSCFSFASDKPSGKLTIYTVNYPLKYFAERIAGEHAKVVFPAPKDIDPAYWMPDRKTISEYQKADLILLNGAHYAKWTEKVSLPRSKMVDTSRKFKDQYIRTNEAVTHSHGPKGKHAHENVAFTVWLNLDLAARQARAIADTLSRKRPALKTTFEQNYKAVEKDLIMLDQEIKEITSNKQTKPLIVSHPVYQYFAKQYGLNVKSVHWEPDEMPGYDHWSNLRKIMESHPAQWMMWEGEPLIESVEKLKSMGLNSIVFAPCGNVPERGDFHSVMKENVENIKLAFK
jgi:zinc transport system substrate-binding protein